MKKTIYIKTPTSQELPPMIDGSSENLIVWQDGIRMVMCLSEIEGNNLWCNCHGDIDGDAYCDDDYHPEFWLKEEEVHVFTSDEVQEIRAALKQSVYNFEYAAFNIDGSKLKNLPPNITGSTGVSDSCLIQARNNINLLGKLF